MRNRFALDIAHFLLLLVLCLGVNTCVPVLDSDLPAGSPMADDDQSPGDDDLTSGDDDTSVGDDDVTTGDDDTSVEDDDGTTGDDDTSPGDDDTAAATETPPAMTPTLAPLQDRDGDGFLAGEDCDDGDPAIYPGATELCDGADNDCNGTADDGLPTNVFYADADGDGHGDPTNVVEDCRLPAGASATGDDCDDADPLTYSGALESCDSKDNDCDGEIDEDVTEQTFYPDEDGDRYGDSAGAVTDCQAPAGSYVLDNGDCDDSDPTIHPGGVEVCDGVDQDCDAQVDEGVQSLFYPDGDCDGFAASDAEPTYACSAPAGEGCSFATVTGDCDDGAADVYPGAQETCNGVDDDCDGTPDQGLTSSYYPDGDGDGFGDSSGRVEACSLPEGYVSEGGDCDDGNVNKHPMAVSPGGSRNGKGTFDDPVASIQDAIDDSQNCDVVLVLPGSYTGHIILQDVQDFVLRATGSFEDTDVLSSGGQRTIYVNRATGLTIQGLTIRAGDLVDGPGAAVLVENSTSVTFQEIRVAYSTASGADGVGGGIALVDSRDVQILDTTIDHNSAQLGGGVLCTGCTLTVERTLFEANDAGTHGGGLAAIGSADATQVLVADDTVFSNNRAEYYGGGAYADEASLLELRGAWFLSNHVSTNLGGAAHNPSYVEHCVFAWNDSSSGSVSDGGALGLERTATIVNSIFVENAAFMGGAILIDAAGFGTNVERFDIVNNTFVGNMAESGNGTALYLFDGDTVVFRNNIVLDRGGDSSSAVYNVTRESLTIDHNDVFVASGVTYRGAGIDTSTIDGNDGNKTADPLFISEDTSSLGAWDFHLQADSPCANSGDPNVGRDPDGSAPDMGAYGGPGGDW